MERQKVILRTNPRYIFARVSLKDILLSAGPFSREFVELSFKTPEICQFIYELLEQLNCSPKTRQDIIKMFRDKGCELDILDKLEKTKVIIADMPDSRKEEGILIVKNGEGLVAESLEKHLKAVGFTASIVDPGQGVRAGQLLVAGLDSWVPRYLRELEETTLNNGGHFLPVVYITEGAFIGPYATRQSARYEDFEAQFDASLFSWIGWRLFKETIGEHGSKPIATPPLPHVEFVTSLTAMLVDKQLKSTDGPLSNKVVLVDLVSLFIEDVRIYRVHTGGTIPKMEL